MAAFSPLRAFSEIPAPVRGALWMVASCACVAVITVLVRHLSHSLHPFEIVFFRNFFSLAFTLPWLLRSGLASVHTRRFPLHALRAATGAISLLAWYGALALMPVAEATALNFTAPLFTTLAAAVVLGEAVGGRRLAAVAVGFVGTLMILRPGADAVGLPAALVLVSSAFTAASMLCVKSLSRTESAHTIVFYMAFLLTPGSLVPALFVWTAPPLAALGWLAVIGACASVGQMAVANAFAAADTSAVMPFDFSRLIFVALLGFAVFGERPDLWTWAGATVIFASALYTARSEATRGKPNLPAAAEPPRRR